MAEMIKMYFCATSEPMQLPRKRKILHLEEDVQGRPCMWVMIDTEADLEPVQFIAYKDDVAISDEKELSYVGTVYFRKPDGPITGVAISFFEVTSL